jgi:hypothetical protein
MHRLCRPAFAAVIAGLSASAARAVCPQDEKPARVEALRLEAAPIIDGRLDEAQWQGAAIITDLKQMKPGSCDAPSEPTEIRVAYDKDALYIGARIVDRRGPSAITANNMRQGSRLPDDDRLAFLIDPTGSGRGAFRFEVNLNSVRNDMIYQNGELQGDWDAIWDARSVLTDEGWSTEIAIPFKTLPNDPNVEAWGFNISRAIRSRGEEDVWVQRNRSWGPSIVGELAGIRDVDQGVGLDIVPTLGLRELRFFDNGVSDRQEANPSLDAYYRVTPALSASLTVNTDFSGTDTDARQVNLTRFNLFFPEKRDFFLKDADLFDFGRIAQDGRPFFSRNIGLSPTGTPIDVNYGGKVSGRIGRWALGVMTVRQDRSGALDPSTLSVARVAADVLGESSVGMIATSGDPYSNNASSLIGADFLYLNSRFSGNRTLDGEAWVQKSSNSGVAGDQSAFGMGLRLIDNAGWEYGGEYSRLGKSFRPALGFVSRPGTQDIDAFVGYTQLTQALGLQRVYYGMEFSQTRTNNNQLESQQLTFMPAEFETRGRDILMLSYTHEKEVLRAPFAIYTNPATGVPVVIPAGNYSFGSYGFKFVGGQQRRLVTNLDASRGSFYDGHKTTAALDATWKQSKYLSMRLGYSFNDIDLDAGDFTTRILTAGLNVNFSSRLSWTNLLQYDNVSETAGLQSHLHYIPKAGQELVVIVNHSSQDLDRDGNFRSVAAEYGARMSYTFRF